MTETLRGRRKKWQLIEQVGEGDAGEVWLARGEEQGVECVVKRPSRRAYGSDIYRQAAQIAQEGRILQHIGQQQVKIAGTVIRPVQVKDDSGLDDNGGREVFIVLERARGFDLKYLSELRNSLSRASTLDVGETGRFLRMFAKLEHFPALLAFRMVAGLAALLDAVHRTPLTISGKGYHGVVWNDIKLDHVFWDPFTQEFTIIDWGNAQLLGADGVSEDRRYSPQSDYQQFCEEIRRFLSRGAPDVLHRLALSDCGTMTRDGWRRVASAARRAAEQEYRDLQRLRHEEEQRMRRLDEAGLVKIQRQIIASGEVPDETALHKHWQEEAQQAIQALDWRRFRRAQRKLGGRVFAADDLFNDILQLALQCPGDDIERLHRVVEAVREEQWPRAFWELAYISDQVNDELLKRLRVRVRARAGVPEPGITPLDILRRAATRLDGDDREKLESVIAAWKEDSPKPSPYWLQYDLDIEAVETILLPNEHQRFVTLLKPSQVIAEMAVIAWRDKNFEALKEKLLEWLLYDPDRKRIVFRLPWHIRDASRWLDDFEKGPPGTYDQRGGWFPGAQYTSSQWQKWRHNLLARGRGLRIAADVAWLEDRLSFLEDWNKGRQLGELAGQYTQLTPELPWLAEYDSLNALRKFYSRLQKCKYGEAQGIANSALKKYTGYGRLVREFRALESEIRGRTLDSDTLESAVQFAKAGFHPKDQNWNQAYDLLSRLRPWYQDVGQKTLQQNWEALNEIHKKHSVWALVGAIKTAFGRWQTYYPHLAELVKHAWRLPEGNDLPVSYQAPIDVLQETLEWVKSHRRWDRLPQLGEQLKDAQSRIKNWSPSDLGERLFKRCVAGRLEGHLTQVVIAVEGVQRIHAEWSRNRENQEIERRFREQLQYLQRLLEGGMAPCPSRPKTAAKGRSKAVWRKIVGVGKVVAWGYGILIAFCVLAVLALVYKLKISEPPPPTSTLAIAADTPSAAVVGAPAQGGSTQALSPTATSTAQPIPTVTTVITLTSLPDASEGCNNFRRWAAESAWESFLEGLSALSQDDYLRVQAICGWNYTYDQLQLEIGLLEVQNRFLLQDEASSEQRLRQLHSEWVARPPVDDILRRINALDYAQWLRVSLALCHLPDSLTDTQRSVLQTYWPTHVNAFPKAKQAFKRVCGGVVPDFSQKPKAESEPFSLAALNAWPSYHHQECAFLGDNKTIRWKLSSQQNVCVAPRFIQEALPSWAEAVALDLSFCLVSDQQNTTDDLTLTLWLSREQAEFGVQLQTRERVLQTVTRQERWPLAGVLSVGPTSNPWLQDYDFNKIICEASNFAEPLQLRAVWVENLLFWQITTSGADWKSASPPLGPQVWPAVSSSLGERVEFYWELVPGWNSSEDNPAKAHIYFPKLELERRK